MYVFFCSDLFDGVEQSEDDESEPQQQNAEPVKTNKKNAPKGGVSLFGGAIKKGFFKVLRICVFSLRIQ